MNRMLFRATATVAAVLMLAAACGTPEPAPTIAPPASTIPVTGSTATLLPETDTPEPPSAAPTNMETPTPTTTAPPLTDTPLPPSTTPTSEPQRALSPAAANLQGSILFSVYPDGDIAVMNVGGRNRTLLLDRTMPGDVFSDRLAIWRPNGEGVSYTVDDFELVEIWSMDGDGGNAQSLVGDVEPVTSHSWSPDGTRIAFVVSGHGICILDITDQTVTNLTGEGQSEVYLTDARDPDWSPDGSILAFSASDRQNQDIYVINVDGTGLTRLTSHDARDRHPDWSPDGAAIAFSSTRRSKRYPDIHLLDLSLGTEEQGNIPVQLTSGDRLEIRPDWSPDGSWIAFLSHELGAEHGTIYAVSVDGTLLVQVTADNVYHSPRWRP